jgi:hypothetical protein
MRNIALIDDADVIERILKHLKMAYRRTHRTKAVLHEAARAGITCEGPEEPNLQATLIASTQSNYFPTPTVN